MAASDQDAHVRFENVQKSYDGVNLVIADSESGWVIHGTDDPEVVELEQGLSIIANSERAVNLRN